MNDLVVIAPGFVVARGLVRSATVTSPGKKHVVDVRFRDGAIEAVQYDANDVALKGLERSVESLARTPVDVMVDADLYGEGA